jgi:hypothetical protein
MAYVEFEGKLDNPADAQVKFIPFDGALDKPGDQGIIASAMNSVMNWQSNPANPHRGFADALDDALNADQNYTPTLADKSDVAQAVPAEIGRLGTSANELGRSLVGGAANYLNRFNLLSDSSTQAIDQSNVDAFQRDMHTEDANPSYQAKTTAGIVAQSLTHMAPAIAASLVVPEVGVPAFAAQGGWDAGKAAIDQGDRLTNAQLKAGGQAALNSVLGEVIGGSGNKLLEQMPVIGRAFVPSAVDTGEQLMARAAQGAATMAVFKPAGTALDYAVDKLTGEDAGKNYDWAPNAADLITGALATMPHAALEYAGDKSYHKEIAAAIDNTNLDHSDANAQAVARLNPYSYDPNAISPQEIVMSPPAPIAAKPMQTGIAVADQPSIVPQPTAQASVDPTLASQRASLLAIKEQSVAQLRTPELLTGDPMNEANAVLGAPTVDDAAAQANAIVNLPVRDMRQDEPEALQQPVSPTPLASAAGVDSKPINTPAEVMPEPPPEAIQAQQPDNEDKARANQVGPPAVIAHDDVQEQTSNGGGNTLGLDSANNLGEGPEADGAKPEMEGNAGQVSDNPFLRKSGSGLTFLSRSEASEFREKNRLDMDVLPHPSGVGFSLVPREPIFNEAKRNNVKNESDAYAEGLTTDQAAKILSIKFGKGFSNLQDRGILKLVQSVDDLPPGARSDMDGTEGGVYWKGTGYIVADNQSRSKIVRDVIHEIGEHHGFQPMMGGDGYARLLRDVTLMKRSGNPFLSKIWATTKQFHDAPEGSEAFLKEIISKLGESAEGRATSPWNRISVEMRKFLSKSGLRNFNHRDVADLVAAGLQKTMEKAGPSDELRKASQPLQTRSMEREAIEAAKYLITTPAWRSYRDSYIGAQKEVLEKYEWAVQSNDNSEYQRALEATALLERIKLQSATEGNAHNVSARTVFNEIYFRPEEGAASLIDPLTLGNQNAAKKGGMIGRDNARIIQWLAEKMGTQVHFFTQDSKEPSVEGITDQGYKSHIFINAALGSIGWQYVIGHEFLHQMPIDLKNAFIKEIQKLVTPENYLKAKQYVSQPWLSTDAQWEEIAADLMGNRFGEPAFWDRVLTGFSDPSLMEKLIDYLKEFLTKLREVSYSSFRTDFFVRDLEQVRDQAAHVLRTHIARRCALNDLSIQMTDRERKTKRTVPRDKNFAFPDVIVAHDDGAMRIPDDYAAAKAGSSGAVQSAVKSLLTPELLDRVRKISDGLNPIVQPVTRIGNERSNRLAEEASAVLSERLHLHSGGDIVESMQSGEADESGTNGLDRVFKRPVFEGPVEPGRRYLLVDDKLAEGGTFAALARHIEEHGGHVIGAVALTGKSYNAKLALSDATFARLQKRHGHDEDLFSDKTGRGFGQLTEPEARLLANHYPADAVRKRLARLIPVSEPVANEATQRGGLSFGGIDNSALAAPARVRGIGAGPQVGAPKNTMPFSANGSKQPEPPPDEAMTDRRSIGSDNPEKATPSGGLSASGAGDADTEYSLDDASKGEEQSSASIGPNEAMLHDAEIFAQAYCANVEGAKIEKVTVEKNVVSWLVNAAGAPIQTWGVLESYQKGVKRSLAERWMQRKITKGNRKDDGGHFMAHRFVGNQGMKNLFSQSRNLNRSAYKTMENDMARFIDQGNKVEFRHTLADFDQDGRPGSVLVEYQVIGKNGQPSLIFKQKFSNEDGQMYQRKA